MIPAVSLGPPPSVSSGDTSAPIAAPAPKTSSVVPSQPQGAPPGFAAPSSTQQAPSTGLQLNANNMTSLLASLINTTGSAQPPEQQQRTQTHDKDGNGPPGFASSPVQGAVPAQSDMAMSAPPGFAPKVSQQVSTQLGKQSSSPFNPRRFHHWRILKGRAVSRAFVEHTCTP